MGKVVKFQKPKPRPTPPDGRASTIPVVIGALLFLAVAVAASLIGLPKRSFERRSDLSAQSAASTNAAVFTLCRTGGGTNCVIDGDTFWVGGEKIRISDIDAPETHPPRCQSEAELGKRATVRLQELLNAGPFELEPDARDQDRYGRKLRVVKRDGKSIGLQLVSEGIARKWDGGRRPWC
jgi:micrococcal nuclease